MTTAIRRRLPIGAEFIPGTGAHFRVWAPHASSVHVVLDSPHSIALENENNGYFSGFADANPGAFYGFRLDEKSAIYPDPASRYQPNGPHGNSEIVDPLTFQWTDQNWRGVSLQG